MTAKIYTTIQGAAFLLSTPKVTVSRTKVTTMVQDGDLEASLYDKPTGTKMVPYRKREDRHDVAMVYIAIDDLALEYPEIPPDCPKGRVVTKEGAAFMLGVTTDWIRDLARKGTLLSFVYDENMVFLRPFNRQEEGKSSKVFHFPVSVIKAYKESIEAYKSEPAIERSRPSIEKLSEAQLASILKLADEQIILTGFVSTNQIRSEMGFSSYYDPLLRELRATYGWPVRYPKSQESRKKIVV